MSGFVAILRFDGAPVDPAALAAMTQAIAYRGPHGIRHWSGEGAALGHLMLHATAESLEEVQPLASEDESLVLVMDGWLANPEELRADLLSRGARLRTRSDAELVLRAYETWGDECPKRIDGEYACVIWDVRQREAFCLRDHAGMRPLHYHWDGKRLLVASDIAGIVAAGDFEPRPNLGMVAEHLANVWFSQDETLWDGIMRQLPAHSMRVGPAGPRLRRYWTPPLDSTLRYARDEEYQEHYRELLADCVCRASRTHLPLACEVSGGLDSSGVFAMAAGLLREERLLAPSLRGYTFDFGPDSDPAVDELEYGRAVGEHLGMAIREIRPFLPDFAWFARRGWEDRDMAPYPNAAMAAAIGQAAVADGSRVVLNGEGGDEFLTGNPFYYHEHLLERDAAGFVRSFREDRAAGGLGAALRKVARYGLRPAVPRPLRALRRRLIGSREADSFGLGLAWLTPDLRRRLRERRKAFDRTVLDRIPSAARRGLYLTLNDGFYGFAHDYLGRNAARLGYELRSPMYDRRLIEFAFSLPARQRMRGGVRKYVHTAALAGILPDKVLLRRTDVQFNLPFERALDSAGIPMLDRLLQCGIDFIDRAGLEELLECYRRAPFGFRPIYELWAIVGCVNLFGRADGEGLDWDKEHSDVDFR